MNQSFLPSSFPTRLIVLVTAVIIIVLTNVKFAKSCHRRVEYHHYVKKQPHKGWGWGWGQNGHGGGHKGWGGWGWDKGHGHGKGYEQKGKGHGHGHEGYGGGGHKGYEMKGHGHKGYEMKGYGHGGGHKGYEMKGHGHGGYGGGHDKGHGGGHEKGYGGHDKGYGGHGHEKGHGGGGYESSPMHNKGRGMKYKHASFEMVRYGDKGGGVHHDHDGFDTAQHNQRGYGYSGPYPNTEYSSHVPTAFDPLQNEVGPAAGASSLDLGAADVANYIRNSKSPQNRANRGSPYLATPILMNNLPRSPSKSKPSSSSPEGEFSDDGNFDLNLDFNGEVPPPFRRSDSSSSVPQGTGKNKKLSSRFTANDGLGSLDDSAGVGLNIDDT